MRNYPLRNLARLARTVRYMRPGQVVNRIARRFKSLPPTDGAAPSLRETQSVWRNCPGRLPGMLSPQRFRFIGQEGELKDAFGWNRPGLYESRMISNLLTNRIPFSSRNVGRHLVLLAEALYTRDGGRELGRLFEGASSVPVHYVDHHEAHA